jgi:putative endonuclease
MHYVYILKNEDNKELYYGYTNNLERRFGEHNTDDKWKLIYYEAYLSELDARKREIKLKHYGQSRTRLKSRLKESLKL